jgi:hypothetical protein
VLHWIVKQAQKGTSCLWFHRAPFGHHSVLRMERKEATKYKNLVSVEQEDLQGNALSQLIRNKWNIVVFDGLITQDDVKKSLSVHIECNRNIDQCRFIYVRWVGSDQTVHGINVGKRLHHGKLV